MGPVISVFVMVLVISILAGLTFLFVASLKTNVVDTTISATTATDNNVYINATGYTLAGASDLEATGYVITLVKNATDDVTILSGNYTVSSLGVLTNASVTNWADVNVTYSYNRIAESHRNAYDSVVGTEDAGAGVVGYLPLIFIALIFGAVLTLVLKIILPYINLGNQMEGF